MNILSLFTKSRELVIYTFVGGIATLMDWGIFALCINQFELPYEIALALGFCLAGVFHYTANKFLTFKCDSKELASQLSLFVVVMLVSLLCSMGVLSLLIKLFQADKVLLRMATTILMLVPNYLLHKYITFSRRLFAH